MRQNLKENKAQSASTVTATANNDQIINKFFSNALSDKKRSLGIEQSQYLFCHITIINRRYIITVIIVYTSGL